MTRGHRRASETNDDAPRELLGGLSLVCLFVAIRRVSRRGWTATALQAAGLLLWFCVLLAAWLGSVMALATRLTLP